MKKNKKVYLQDILDSINSIRAYVYEKDFADFEGNTLLQDAVVRRLEIMGEAVKKIDSAVKNKYPNVKWREIAGMRDVLIHDYFGVNLKRVWNVIVNELDDLKIQIENILKEM